MPGSRACISPNDRGFTHADGVYEIVRSYAGTLFRIPDHLARLKRSLAAVRIAVPDVDTFAETAAELLRRNRLDKKDATVYIQITRGIAERMRAPGPAIPTVYIETSPLIARRALCRGVSVITLPDIRWGRCDIKTIGLLPNALARMQATDKGVYEALFIRDGFVTEGTHTNVFGVKDGTVLTHPPDHHILPGITRTVLLELCRALGIPISESPIPEPELTRLDELFLTCTTAEVIPVLRVNDVAVADGKPGPITRRLQSAFRRLSRRA
jgi:D-alanine transaminase